ncbi:alanine:cation symporter family protein [Staphylococcus aureus]
MVLVILLFNLDQIVPMIGTIIKSAFGIEQVTGGAVGAAVLPKVSNVVYSLTKLVWVLRRMQRIAAVPHPVKQGLIQSLGCLLYLIQCWFVQQLQS